MINIFFYFSSVYLWIYECQIYRCVCVCVCYALIRTCMKGCVTLRIILYDWRYQKTLVAILRSATSSFLWTRIRLTKHIQRDEGERDAGVIRRENGVDRVFVCMCNHSRTMEIPMGWIRHSHDANPDLLRPDRTSSNRYQRYTPLPPSISSHDSSTTESLLSRTALRWTMHTEGGWRTTSNKLRRQEWRAKLCELMVETSRCNNAKLWLQDDQSWERNFPQCHRIMLHNVTVSCAACVA